MNSLWLLAVGILGIVVGVYLTRRFYFGRERWLGDLIKEQSDKKREGKAKILEAIRQSEGKKIANNDIERLLNVSDSTATRYMVELEEEGKVRQVGTTGQGVYYVLN